MIKKKYRWVFEGKDNEGRTVFPSSFIVTKNVNEFDLPEGPNRILINQSFLFSSLEEAKISFESCKNYHHVRQAELRCYDGCGFEEAKWMLGEVEMVLNQGTGLPDEIVEWIVSYNFRKSLTKDGRDEYERILSRGT